MKYTITKPCMLDRSYAVGETVSEEFIAPYMVDKLMKFGVIKKCGESKPQIAEKAPQTAAEVKDDKVIAETENAPQTSAEPPQGQHKGRSKLK